MLASNTTNWITAIGSAFAAVGTVGAVAFALWQVRRQDRRKLKLRVYESFEMYGPPGAQQARIIVVPRGTSEARRSIRIESHFFLTDTGARFPFPTNKGTMFPHTIAEDETVEAAWTKENMDLLIRSAKLSALVACGFTDTLGNSYVTPYHSKAVRKGWRRRKMYRPEPPK